MPRYNYRIQNKIMKLSPNMIPHIIPKAISPQNGLDPLVQNAIASAQLEVDQRAYCLVGHIPVGKLAQAKPYLESLLRPVGGYNAVLSHGNWFHPTKKTWVPEPILLVRSYMTAKDVEQHLGTMLQGYYAMGKALGESAMALELIDNSQMLIIPTE